MNPGVVKVEHQERVSVTFGHELELTWVPVEWARLFAEAPAMKELLQRVAGHLHPSEPLRQDIEACLRRIEGGDDGSK